MGIYLCGPFCLEIVIIVPPGKSGCKLHRYSHFKKGCDRMGHKDDVRMDKSVVEENLIENRQ